MVAVAVFRLVRLGSYSSAFTRVFVLYFASYCIQQSEWVIADVSLSKVFQKTLRENGAISHPMQIEPYSLLMSRLESYSIIVLNNKENKWIHLSKQTSESKSDRLKELETLLEEKDDELEMTKAFATHEIEELQEKLAGANK